jgi:hypothetical protein
MNSKERLLAALKGQPVDRTPFSPFLAYVWESFPREIQEAGALAFHKEIGADPLWRGSPCPCYAEPPEGIESQTAEDNGRTVTIINTPVGSLRMAAINSGSGNTSFLVEHPLKTEEDYKVQMWIEENTRFVPYPQATRDHLAGEGREGLSLGMLIPRGKSAYQQMVEHLAGTEELIYAQMDFPDTVRSLWQIMVEKDLEAVRLALDSEYEYFITWEDSSTQNYSPAQYDQFIGSEIGQWCEMLAGAGKKYVQHACGHVAALVGRMKDQGARAIESLSTPPTGNITLQDARSIAGPEMGIIGGIEPTRFLQLSDNDLETYVLSVMEDAGGGPFVLANSDSCPPGVTLERFKRVAGIARHYRP